MIITVLLISITLSLNASCVWFLYHSFFSVGLPTLYAMAAGAWFEKTGCFFGARWELVESALRQKAEVTVGLFFLLLATICNVIISFVKSTPPTFIVVCLLCLFALKVTVILCSCFYYKIVPYLYYRYFIYAVKESLYRQIVKMGETSKKENREIWIGPDGDKNIKDEIKLYNLNTYENRAFRVLKKYLISISTSHDLD